MLENFFQRVTAVMGPIAEPRLRPDGPVAVIDGDGIEWQGHQCRLAGFDAPEIGTKARSALELDRGLQAARRLHELVRPPNRTEVKVLKPHGGGFGRALVQLLVNGKDVRDIAIEEGWGMKYEGKKGTKPNWGDPSTPFRAPPPSHSDQDFIPFHVDIGSRRQRAHHNRT